MATNFCNECGTPFQAQEGFCTNCGTPRTNAGQGVAAAGAPGGPPAGPPFVPAPTGDSNNRNVWMIVAAVLAVLVIGVALAVVLTKDDAAEAGEVFLAPADVPGPDPFTTELAVANPTTTAPPETTTTAGPTTTAGGGAAEARASSNGNAPGLYGGTQNVARCDPAQLVAFLQANPDKASAWVNALNADSSLQWSGGSTVSVSDIEDFVAELTPVTLTADTRVTNHGYRNGQFTTIPSVLQAGTAVLVDAYGVPRVKCNCGNPLTQPAPVQGKVTYTGSRWRTWSPTNVTVVVQTTVVINTYVLVNLSGPGYLDRPVGTTGDADTESDYDPDGSTPSTTSPPATTTTTTEPDVPEGDFCEVARTWFAELSAWVTEAFETDSVPSTAAILPLNEQMIELAPTPAIKAELEELQAYLLNPDLEGEWTSTALEAYLPSNCGIDVGG